MGKREREKEKEKEKEKEEKGEKEGYVVVQLFHSQKKMMGMELK